jgi:hypothetical protein
VRVVAELGDVLRRHAERVGLELEAALAAVAFDRANNRTGRYLMVHGTCSSSGCFAMTDEAISEISGSSAPG